MMTCDMTPESLHTWTTFLRAEHHFNAFQSNDLVEFCGRLTGMYVRTLRVNGLRPITLNQSEFCVSMVLACHARCKRSLPAPRVVEADTFLNAKVICDILDTWSVPTHGPQWIFTTIFKLRKRLTHHHTLIENNEAGYRLSTPAFNITIPHSL